MSVKPRKRLSEIQIKSMTIIASGIVVFGIIGVALLANSHAAIPTAASEPELGTVTSPATTVSDTTASGNQAVKFLAGGTVPAQCASGGTFLWSNLVTCGWPGPTNTGYDASQCPGGLTNVGTSKTTTITLSAANTTISCENITGNLQITAQNVTIKNSKITGDGGGAGGSGVVNINDGGSATVDHVEINGSLHTHACIWDEGVKGATLTHSMVAKSVNCYGVNDGIFSWWWASDRNAGAGSDFIIQDSYFHDFTEDAANGHIDGYQTEGAQNGSISHNTYLMERAVGDKNVSGGGMDSAIAIWDDYNQSTPTGKVAGSITADNNLITGGGFAIYAEDYSPGDGGPGDPAATGGNTLTDVHFTNNKFSTFYGSCVGDYGVWFFRSSWSPYFGGPTDGWNTGGSTRVGNKILETGFNLDNGNPNGCS